MKQLILTVICLLGAIVARAMTPEEFETLYNSPQKDAEKCYSLYQAFAQGDGVDKDDARARKWLLAAHRCGKEGARAELEKLPWRKTYKLKKSIKVSKVDDATARTKGEDLVKLLLELSGRCNKNMSSSVKKLSTAEMKAVRKLIAEGADLNIMYAETEFDGFTALSIACHHSDFALAKLLIDHGADPNACSMLALETVGRPGTDADKALSKKAIQFLIKNGMEVNMWTDYGWPTAMLMAFLDSEAEIDVLAKAGMDVNLRANPHECVSAALPAKRMSYFTEMAHVKAGQTALLFAARCVHAKSVTALLRNGADPHITDDTKGETFEDVFGEVEKYAEKPDGSPLVKENARTICRLLRRAGAKPAKK